MRPPNPRVVTFLGLVLCFGFALTLRALGAPFVFVGEDVILDPWDGAYHARRAFYTFARFPEILFFDPYLRYPAGAPVPFPPLYDWAVGAFARLFGSDPATFGRVAAWVSPVLSAACVWPLHAVARRLFGQQAGWLACVLFALFPASTMNAGVGDLDHHAAVGLWVVSMVAFGLRFSADDRMASLPAIFCGAALRATLPLIWTGSLLYLVVAEAALLLAHAHRSDATRARHSMIACVLAAGAVAPFVVAAGTPLGGDFSSTELSWLHVLALVAAASVWGGLWRWQQLAGAPDWRASIVRTAGVSGCLLVLLLLVPPIREALLPGLSFVAKADSWAPVNAEQAPLFPWMQPGPPLGGDLSHVLFGGFAYFIPLVPLVAWWGARDRASTAERILFAAWSGVLGALCLLQLRFGSDYAALAAVGFAGLVVAGVQWTAPRLPDLARRAVSVSLAIVLLWPALATHRPRIPTFLSFVAGEPAPVDRSLAHGDAALVRFAERIHAHTPETSGYLDPETAPEYAVLALPSHGHVLHWAARRPTPANNFGPYLDAEKVDAANLFYTTHKENEAIAIMEELGARYAMTSAAFWLVPGSVAYGLHGHDGGVAPKTAAIGRLRLVTESAAGSRTTFAAFPRGAPRNVIAYKLWERVAGAQLEVPAPPRSRVRVEVPLVTEAGRAFVYAAHDWADGEGVARLRVPYGTDATEGTRARGPYRVRDRTRETDLAVPERFVRAGQSVQVDWGESRARSDAAPDAAQVEGMEPAHPLE